MTITIRNVKYIVVDESMAIQFIIEVAITEQFYTITVVCSCMFSLRNAKEIIQ